MFGCRQDDLFHTLYLTKIKKELNQNLKHIAQSNDKLAKAFSEHSKHSSNLHNVIEDLTVIVKNQIARDLLAATKQSIPVLVPSSISTPKPHTVTSAIQPSTSQTTSTSKPSSSSSSQTTSTSKSSTHSAPRDSKSSQSSRLKASSSHSSRRHHEQRKVKFCTKKEVFAFSKDEELVQPVNMTNLKKIHLEKPSAKCQARDAYAND